MDPKNVKQAAADQSKIHIYNSRSMYVGLALCFLLIHVLMLIMFSTYGVVPMVRFNWFSIVFYLFCLILIRKNRIYEFVLLSYFEVLLHMCLAICYTGWENGFQITLIGMNVLLFFSEYFGRMLETKYVHAAPVCMIGLFTYLLTFFITHTRTAPYPLPQNISFVLQVAWAVIVFCISIFILEIFVLTTFHSEKYLFMKAGQDELTGLLNRYSANSRLDELISTEESGNAWAAMIDIDNFKGINDTYGHNCGDYVLRTLAGIMRDIFGKNACFRWGGEEFLIIGTDREDAPSAQEKLERLCRTVENHEFAFEGNKLRLTVTSGLAFYEAGMDREQWIQKADMRLYKGKTSGKNQVVTSG